LGLGRGVSAEPRLTEDGDECDGLGSSPYAVMSGESISVNAVGIIRGRAFPVAAALRRLKKFVHPS
jgi:hypothetical protein